MTKLLLGIDLGTSSLKIAVYTERFELAAAVRREYHTLFTADGGAEQNADQWWEAFVHGMAELKEKVNLSSVEAVGFSGFNALVGVSRDGSPSGPAITYLDRRLLGVYHKLAQRIPGDDIFRLTKNRFSSSGMWAPTLCWIREELPAYWRNTYKFVSSSGFLAGKLTGRYAVDGSRASLSLLHDPGAVNLEWNSGLCRLFEVDQSKLPPIIQSWEPVGPLHADAGKQCGLREGISVIIGGMDALCAALANGLTHSSVLFDIGGSAGGLAIIDQKIHPDQRFFNVRYVMPGYWANIGPLSAAGSAWKWYREQMMGGWLSNQELLQWAEQAEPGAGGVAFLPYLAGARSPQWDMTAQAAFHGVTMHHHFGHFGRAILEGVTYAHKDILYGIHDLGFMPREVRVAGGQSRNEFWLQMKADILELTHTCLTIQESSAFGAALLAAQGVGWISDMSLFVHELSQIALKREPRVENREAYNQIYHRWCSLRDHMFKEKAHYM